MVDVLPSDEQLEEILRDTLRGYPEMGAYSEFIRKTTRLTSHAHISHLILRNPNDYGEQHFGLKTFFPVIGTGDLEFANRHDPGYLSTKEARAVDWIDRDVRIPTDKGSEKSYLVPPFFGHSSRHNAITTRFFRGRVLHDILTAKGISDEYFQTFFLMGLKDVARLNGLTNAPGHNFYSNQSDFDHFASINADENKKSLLANLARMAYTLNPREFEGQMFVTEGVVEQMEKRGVDLKASVKELSDMRPSIGEPTRLQHRDCSGLNMIITANKRYSNRFVDLETFGPDSAVEDVASYCIILARGNNDVFRNADFPHYRHVFHAYEHAWRDRDSETVKYLNTLNNGQFRAFLEPLMTGREYADLTAAFFSNAIVKTMHLAAAGARSPGNEELGIDAIAVTNQDRWHSDMNELFRAVSSMGKLINNCSNPNNVREYFYALGNTLVNVGYNLDRDVLRDIKNGGGIGPNVMDQVPNFTKQD